MEPYHHSSSALLDGVAELERFFSNYKSDIFSLLRGGSKGRPQGQISPTRGGRNNNNDDSPLHPPPPTTLFGGSATTTTAREQHRATTEAEEFNRRLLGKGHGVIDVVRHLFTMHGTSHTLLDAIEHLDLLVPNWHEPRRDGDGSLLETPKMRMLAMRTAEESAATTSYSPSASSPSASPSRAPHQQQNQQQQHQQPQRRWKKTYTVADICEFTGLRNDYAVVRLLERDRGVGTKLWKVQMPVDEDGAPAASDAWPGPSRAFAGTDPQTKKPCGWRSRLKFATALRAIQDRDFVSPEARDAVRHLEQQVLPSCSFEPNDLISMSHALNSKLVFDADRATRKEMIEDLQQQIRAIESFVRALEKDQQQMSGDGEMAQLRHAAVQQLEWYERLLRACENQFDVACEDVSTVEAARKQRHWDIFRSSRGDLPAVQTRIAARKGRLQSAASKVRDMLHERAAVYEEDLKHLDADIAVSTKHCVEHLGALRGAWDDMLEALQKAAAAEQRFCELGASLRSTVEDRLDLLGARAMKDNSHASLLQSANDVLIDFAEENERLSTSNDLLAELHSIVCSGSNNITDQYDERRKELLKQADELREQHERWVQEYSVALGRHRHRVSSALSDAEEGERRAEMHRELSSDLLDVHTRAHAIARDEAATNKVRLRAELAALDGAFHARNDAFRNRGVQLNLLRQFVEELMRRQEQVRPGKGGLLDDDGKKKNDDDKQQQHDDQSPSSSSSASRRRAEAEAPLNDTRNIDLVNLTSLHHLEKHVRNRFEAAGHSKGEQAVREVLWEKDRIQQAKDASRAAKRVPLSSVAGGASPPPFLSPAPPSATSSTYSGRPPTGAAPRRPGSAAVGGGGSASYVLPPASLFMSSQQQNSNNTNTNKNNDVSRDESNRRAVAALQPSAATTRPQSAPALRTRTGGKIQPGQSLRVVFPFEPRVDDELKLTRGDTVIVLRSGEDPGWAFGVAGDKMGQFPLNYCDAVSI